MIKWRHPHIFIECGWAKLVWFASPMGIQFEEQLSEGLAFKDWLAHFISKSSADVSQLLFSICYGLWHARNKLCFEQLEIPIFQIINKTVSVVEELEVQNTISNQDITSSAPISDTSVASLNNWAPPPSTCYKLNVDAAGPVDGKWGIGVIVRDYFGFVMAAERWRIDCLNDAALAEAKALKLELKFALDLFFINVQVESDSTTVVAAMNYRSTINNYMGMIIQDCKNLRSQFSSFSCTYIRRDVNHAADSLAKSVLSSDDRIWIEEIPNCISHIIALDCSSVLVD